MDRPPLRCLEFSSNYDPLEDFEGLTPNDMHGLLYRPFDEQESPLKLAGMVDRSAIVEVQIYKDVVQYLTMLRERQPMTLTQKGNLPRSFCRDLCDADLLENEMDREWFKEHSINREVDSHYIHFLNRFTFMAGLTRKAYRKMQLTRRAEGFLDSDPPACPLRARTWPDQGIGHPFLPSRDGRTGSISQ